MTLDETLCLDPWFAACSPRLRELLLSLGREQRLADGQWLFARGDREADLCCVLEGALRVGAASREGREALLARVQPVQWFGEIALIDGQARTHDAVADGATRIWRVPAATLLPSLQREPEHWQAIARLSCAKLRLLFEALEDIALRPLPQRLAKRLLLQAKGYGERAPQRELQLAQEHLALMLGVSRQSVNKALAELEAQGLIARRYAQIELLDAAALQRLAD